MTPPPRNPLTRLLAIVIGVLVLVGVLTIGLVVLAVAAGLGVIFAIAAWIRSRFLAPRRPSAHAETPDQTGKPGHGRDNVIDAEYTVVSRSDNRDD